MLKQTVYLFIKASIIGILINVGIASMPNDDLLSSHPSSPSSEIVTALE